MSVYSIALKRRSIRRFKQKKIPLRILKKLIQAAGAAPSGANLQPCEFVLVNKSEIAEKVFSALKWAGYIAPEGNPPPGKKPVAYIVVLININKCKKPLCAEADAAAAVENILLVAQDEGLGSCWLGAIDRPRLSRVLRVPRFCKVKYVVALGYPDERPKVEKMKDSIKYYKDRKGLLHVPKRSLSEILHRNEY